MRRAKIIATIGPACRDPKVFEAMIAAGADGVRINMSHGTYDDKAGDIRMARAAAEKMNRPLAVLVDLSGPKIRTRHLKDHQPVQLKAGQVFTITTRDIEGDNSQVSTNYEGMPKDVHAGARILVDDGAIELRVESATETDVVTRVINGGSLGERKGINLPGVKLPIPSITEKDREDLNWAAQQRVDYFALSFVRSARDCNEAKELIKQAGSSAPLIAKIEKAEAIDHLEEIIETADGVMVARGDLGVETSVELVPVYQKRIIEQANAAGKLVITATQMLQSMVTNPRPTRAEATDVANAVWDGSDAVMLSGETATGAYPVAAVATMARIIETAETRHTERSIVERLVGRQSGRVSRALCEAAAFAADEMNTRIIAVFTESGLMARRLSALRPDQRIVALTSSREVINELSLIWGVESVLTTPSKSTEELLKVGELALLHEDLVDLGETIVIMAGRLSGLGLSSSVTLYKVEGDIHETV
ncbi:MAG TPA: pyruvate kinase [Pyrinomonadaceae bacterium]|jgi:pyruvate kinase|nr:pyruvate kinase [Pyrinomonadaceae bacterium]